MEYTKGEWRVTSTAPTIPNVLTIYCNARRVALVMPDENQKANAQLIASAPDLYEACKFLLEHYLELANSGDCGFWDTEGEIQVIKARKAIAKAEGK